VFALSGLSELIAAIESLKRSDVKNLVDNRVREFKENGSKPINEVFKEMCFCILTARFSAEKSVKIQEEIGGGFLNLPEDKLAEKLKELGHRYPHLRAKYIVEARKIISNLESILKAIKRGKALREWLVRNVKGLGYKEASHFLRNIGFMDVAIIDFHVINVLAKYGLIEKPRTLTKRRYIEIERVLEGIAKIADLSLGELDLYLWFMETGKVLK
jgi:N-glycosylase/DNA lyase